ncbi:MAG TPA: hypothetical protein VLF66_12200 [Thermoanaerobaculia bacterium]|nr:hypothetical protein [Thermoanaerobaculia bacterium]
MEQRWERLMPNPGEAYDPNLFHLDWNRTFEVLLVIVILSFLVERALAIVFESRLFLSWAKRREDEGRGSAKALFAFAVSALVCVFWKLDAFSVILLQEHTTILGAILTGAIVAGGSKASVKLFVDVLGVRSTAYRELKEGKAPAGANAPAVSRDGTVEAVPAKP